MAFFFVWQFNNNQKRQHCEAIIKSNDKFSVKYCEKISLLFKLLEHCAVCSVESAFDNERTSYSRKCSLFFNFLTNASGKEQTQNTYLVTITKSGTTKKLLQEKIYNETTKCNIAAPHFFRSALFCNTSQIFYVFNKNI